MTNVMYVVYCNVDNCAMWSDTGQVHKAGRVPLGEKLEVIDLVSGWYETLRPANISLPVQPLYPHYFIDPAFCQNEPVGGTEPPIVPPVVPPGDTDDAATGAAFRLLARVLRGE